MKREGKELALFAVLSVAVSLGFYYPFLHNFFFYDDFKYLQNFFVGPLAVLLGYGNLRVVSNLAWWPLFQISGTDPFFYNLFAVLMHAANAALFFLILRRFLKSRFLATVCASIFLVNSVGCDALFWKAASNSLINAFLYLCTLYFYLSYREKGNRSYFLASIAFFLAAIFSKEEAASMPFILILLEVLYFDGLKNWKRTALLAAPFVAAILFYVVAGKLVFDYTLHVPVEHAKLFQIRPLHSLLTCWSVFFLDPHGTLSLASPLMFVTALLMAASFFFVKERKLLLLGYGWILLAFLPQSFTSLGQLDPKYLANSISRYLYITSIGSSIVLGAVLLQLKERLPQKVAYLIAGCFFCFFAVVSYQRVQARGAEWQEQALPTKTFLKAMKAAIPALPRNSHIFVVDPPTGRAFVQQSLQAFYANPDITWIVDPTRYIPAPGDSAYFIICHWNSPSDVSLEFK